MPVPKKRMTQSSRNARRSHDALVAPQLSVAEGGQLLPRRLFKAAKLGLLKKRG